MTDLVSRPEVMIDAWERQPGETAKAFAAFQLYRDLGEERGVTKVRDKCGFNASQKALMEWAHKFNWPERAIAYDRYLDRKAIAAQVEEIEAMARRHVQTGQVLQQRGLEYVKEELDTELQRRERLTPSSALRFIESGVTLERKGMGVDDRPAQGDTNVTVNVLDVNTKADLFAKINQMASNMAAVRELTKAPPPPSEPVEDPEVVDAELVEDEPGDEE